VNKPFQIAPAEGRLAVLLPGLGAVATTLIAGVEAVRLGLAKPIGSLTQLGTVRLGKRTERRTPLIRQLVPLAALEDVRFGAWDVFDDDAYEAARHAAVIEPGLLETIKQPLSAIRPMPAVFSHQYVRRLAGPNIKQGGTKRDLGEALR
jgi:myo-inositol-1-phosphate synthase